MDPISGQSPRRNDVEIAVGPLSATQRVFEDGEELDVDSNWSLECPLIDPEDLAARVVPRKEPADAVDLVEDRFGDGNQVLGVVADEPAFEPARH